MVEVCEQGARIEEEVEDLRAGYETMAERLEALKLDLVERIAALFVNGPVTRLETRISRLEGAVRGLAFQPEKHTSGLNGGGWRWVTLALWLAFTLGTLAGIILGNKAVGLHLPI